MKEGECAGDSVQRGIMLKGGRRCVLDKPVSTLYGARVGGTVMMSSWCRGDVKWTVGGHLNTCVV